MPQSFCFAGTDTVVFPVAVNVVILVAPFASLSTNVLAVPDVDDVVVPLLVKTSQEAAVVPVIILSLKIAVCPVAKVVIKLLPLLFIVIAPLEKLVIQNGCRNAKVDTTGIVSV